MQRLIIIAAIAAAFAAIVSGVAPATAEEQTPQATNVQVANGTNPGEVIITWETASEAKYYRVGSVNIDRDYAAARDNGDWLETFTYIDVVWCN